MLVKKVRGNIQKVRDKIQNEKGAGITSNTLEKLTELQALTLASLSQRTEIS